jgi:cardiolipin synthase
VLQVEGPAVQVLERCCRAGWRHQHFLSPSRRATIQARRKARCGARAGAARPGEIGLLVLGSRRSIHRAYLEALGAARWRICVSAAYFLPDRRLLQALLAAARRGVVVRLILNRWSDHPLLQLASRRLYQQLLAAGVQILEWREGVIHAKTAAVDGVWGTVGSFNLERMSLHFNHEANVAFADPRLARAVERSFEEDCARCAPVTLAAWRARPWWLKLAERACFLFRKLM